MSKTPKFKAKPVFWDTKDKVVRSEIDIEIYRCNGKLKLPEHIWRFDSQHEFKVYLELVRIFGAYRIKRQIPISLLPPRRCYPNGKTWKVDFAIDNGIASNEWTHFVEAKGAFLPEFATTLAILEDKDSWAFDNLFVIFNGKPPATNRVIKSLLKTDFKDHLLSLKELEQLTKLPCLQ